MSDELRSWLKQLPFRLRRELAADMKRIADQLASDIKAKARVKTGKLRDSVRVRRGRNTLELYVEAGGKSTTKEVRTSSGAAYDYALATEFGTSREPAHPFFYNTYRQQQADIRQEISDAVERVISES